MTITAPQLFFGVAADLIAGDPRWLPHPVCGIGHLARWQEHLWRASRLSPRLAGAGAWLGVVAATTGVTYLSILWLPEPYVQIYWIYSFLALRSLDQHAMAVVGALRESDLEAARLAVSYMVGRDTRGLDQREVTRAMMETVAENTSDGVIAPLFWLIAGGPVAMAAYKAINTLDSMFGYRDDRYREFGWWSARADDWANWLPARMTAALFWLVALLWPGMSASRAIRSTFRDAHRQPSPNSGYPEAAAAGALGIQLGGVNSYRGVESTKELLGDVIKQLDWRCYGGMRVLLYGSGLSLVGIVLGALLWR